ncbi:MAG: hypothetical protein H6623_07975 [Bdellovibrionaceae bacterium]|nr:hypothetical protein [Pseudobdellovibrionaceae bacterium]
MASAIKNNHLCKDQKTELIRYTDYKSEEYKVLLYSALMAANGSLAQDKSCALALLIHDREKALSYSRAENTPTCLFIRALILTDQLNLLENSSPKNSENLEGIKILTDLEARYPENGIYTFLKIAPNAKDMMSAENEFFKFIKYKKTENPINSLYLNMLNLSHLNGTAWIKTIEITSGLSVPDYSKGTKIIKEILAHNTPTANVENWIENYHNYMEKIDNLNVSEPFTSVIEIASFRSIGLNYLKTYYPSRKLAGLFDQEEYVAFFRRRYFDPTVDGDGVIILEDEDCALKLKKLNENHSIFMSKQKEGRERLEELRRSL